MEATAFEKLIEQGLLGTLLVVALIAIVRLFILLQKCNAERLADNNKVLDFLGDVKDQLRDQVGAANERTSALNALASAIQAQVPILARIERLIEERKTTRARG